MIEPSHPGLDEQCLARPPAVVRLGSGGRYAVVVTLSSAGLARARTEGLPAISALAMMRIGLIGAIAADAVLRFTTQAALELPSRVDDPATLDALLGWTDPRDPPLVATLTHSANAAHQVLNVPQDLLWFAGHFPGEPVLAGVVQVRWAVEIARRLMHTAGGPGSIRQLKFKSPIRPEALLDLTLTRSEGTSAIAFAFRSASGEHSSGRLHY